MALKLPKPFLFVLVIVLLAGCGQPVQPVASSLLRNMLTDDARHAIQLYPGYSSDSNWQVLREWPQGDIRVLVRGEAGWREIPFPASKTVLALKVFESTDALYLFTYDFELNVPSGRGLQGVSEGADLWRVTRNTSEIVKVAQGLSLGGVDNVLVARAVSGAVDVCTLGHCFRLDANGKVEPWVAGVPEGYQLVELHFKGDGAFALVRRKDDHATGNHDYTVSAYGVVTLHPKELKNSPSFQSVSADCLPFRLRWGWVNSKPNWSCAVSATELAEVFRSDLRRVPHQGVGDIGSSNSEGRIAWSLVYSLSALVHLDSRYTPNLFAAADWKVTREILREALALIARQGLATTLGYASRRYSQNRTPLLFALHLGRIAQLLSEGEAAGFGSPDTKYALEVLHYQLKTLTTTAEVPMRQGPYFTLGYGKGIDFWADGVNVPYNYVSGYVLGLLASAATPAEQSARAAQLLEPLLAQENLATTGNWHYWWGTGRTGWKTADEVSINTPSYAGDSSLAHITYRSMDALAILSLAETMPSAVDTGIVRNLRQRVASGQLLPFVNQGLERLGGAEKLERAVALRYARSAAPWELHAQVFALEALIENSNQKADAHP